MADAPEANDAIWRSVACWGAILIAVGVGANVVYQGWLASEIDLSDRCGPLETARCFTEQTGFVQSVDAHEHSVAVLYDDGRAGATLDLAGDSLPKSGSRIRLERWNNDIVSIYEQGTERRYRTRDWPERGRPFAFVFIMGALLTLLVLGLRALDRSGSRRLRD